MTVCWVRSGQGEASNHKGTKGPLREPSEDPRGLDPLYQLHGQQYCWPLEGFLCFKLYIHGVMRSIWDDDSGRPVAPSTQSSLITG